MNADDPDGPLLPQPPDLTGWIWGCGVLFGMVFGLLGKAIMKWCLSR